MLTLDLLTTPAVAPDGDAIAAVRAAAAALSWRGIQWRRVPLWDRPYTWTVLCNRGRCHAQTGWVYDHRLDNGRWTVSWHGQVAMHASRSYTERTPS